MMDITIPAATVDFNQLLFLIPGAFLAVFILAGLVVVSAPRLYPKRGGDLADAALAVAWVSAVISLAVSLGMASSYDSQKYGEINEAVQESLYEEYGVGGLVSEGEEHLDAVEVACVEGEPDLMERPRISVEWVDEDGRAHRGSLTNMGNVDGECRLVLAEGS